MNRLPPRFTGDINSWTAQLHEYLLGSAEIAQRVNPQALLLASRLEGRPLSATTSGLLLFDPVLNRPVVSVDNTFVAIKITGDT